MSATHELRDAAEFINGVAFRPEDWTESGARIIRIQNLTDPTKPYNRTQRDVDERYVVKRGDILVSWSASLGVFEWRDSEQALLNQHIFRVLPRKGVDKSYLRYALKEALSAMELHLHGATMRHVNRGDFLSTRIPLPSVDEQRRIAAILDQADDLRRKRQEGIDLIEAFSQQLLYWMFGDWQLAERWPLISLGERLSFLTSGSRGWAKFYADSGALFLRIQNVKRDGLDLNDVVYVQAPNSAEARRTLARPGDVLLSITADLGRTAALPEDIGEAYINQHLALLRSSMNPYFLSAILASPVAQAQIQSKNRGGVKAGLNFDDIRSIRIPDIPVDVQNSFAERAAAQERALNNYRHSMDLLNSLFVSLQHKCFSPANEGALVAV